MKQIAMGFIFAFGRAVRTIIVGATAFGMIGGGFFAYADYFVSPPGSGTAFASKVISSVHYAAMVLCDATAGESQCVAVDSSGNVATNAKQSGTWTIQPGNTPNTSPWLFQGNVSNASSGVATGSVSVPSIAYLYGFNGTTWDQLQVNGSKFLKVDIESCASGVCNTNGQTTASASAPVTLASDKNVSLTPYPVGATPITASAVGTTGATTATLAGTSGKTTYICGYSIRANATAAATVTDTLTGVITATMSSLLWVAPAASGLGVDEQLFPTCVPASGTNQAIAAVSGAPGSGGNVTVHAWGYQL